MYAVTCNAHMYIIMTPLFIIVAVEYDYLPFLCWRGPEQVPTTKAINNLKTTD